MKKYNHKESFAVTSDNDTIEFWEPAKAGAKKIKVFANKDGEKRVLASDGGFGWKHQAKKAQYCEYHQVWFGEFPYSSYCWAIQRCLLTGDVTIQTLYTEINPRGLTECEIWQKECQTYVPSSVKADHVA
jgi:hypothetical protein